MGGIESGDSKHRRRWGTDPERYPPDNPTRYLVKIAGRFDPTSRISREMMRDS